MKFVRNIVYVTFLMTVLLACSQQTSENTLEPQAVLPAFPGAEGGGALAQGGRGGRVIYVSNLNDSGPGSLRAALEASGRRTVVFRVAGTVVLESQLAILNPFITIAGQTAPGGGILISAVKIDDPPLFIGTHNVIMRYLKIRTGRGSSYQYGNGDVVSLGEGYSTYNVILDHNSLSWGNDENVSLWSDSGIARNITFSNNIIAEALNHDSHSTGLIVGSNTQSEKITDVDVIRNLFMHNGNRNPYMKVERQRIVNNIIYNWGWQATQISGGVNVDIIGNLYKAGVDDPDRSEIMWRYEPDFPNDRAYGPPGPPSIYLRGNQGPNQSNPNGEQWTTMMEEVGSGNGWGWPGNPAQLKRVNRSYERLTPLPSTVPVTLYPVTQLEQRLLNTVGASRRLDSSGKWVSNRDAVDIRLINEYKNGTGRIRLDENDAGGYPVIASGTPYKDSDRDGMPDVWESNYSLSPNSKDNNADADSDGYTNLEEFLNGTPPR